MKTPVLAMIAALGVTPVLAQSATTTTTTTAPAASATMSMSQMTTPMFVQMAAMSDMFEIQTSQLALQKAGDAEVKRFAQMMIDHHTKMSSQLKAAVQAGNVSAPIPASLTGEKAQMVQQLQGMSGQQFDRMYLQGQVQGHQEALQLMKGYAQSGDNAALKAHAQAGAPIVQDHLQMAQKIAAGGKSS